VEPPANTEADKRALAKRERDEKIRKLEQLAESLRTEIDATEKQIALLERSHTIGEGEDPVRRLAFLRKQLAACEGDLSRLQGELIKLEAEQKQLLREIDLPVEPSPTAVAQAVAKTPAVVTAKAALDVKLAEIAKSKDSGIKDGDPRLVKMNIELEKLQAAFNTATKDAEYEAVKLLQAVEAAQRKQRVEKLNLAIKVKKEEQNARREECESLKKLIDQHQSDQQKVHGVARPDPKALRETVKAKREMLDSANAELAKLRVEAKLNE
jgi:hypothetical protein